MRHAACGPAPEKTHAGACARKKKVCRPRSAARKKKKRKEEGLRTAVRGQKEKKKNPLPRSPGEG